MAASSSEGIVFDTAGEGPPLVLVHGLGSRRQVWAPVLDRLASRRTVHALDLPGSGDSQPLPQPARYDVVTLSGVVARLIAELGLGSPHVAGNSLGGAIALDLARRGAVASATAISPIGFWSPGEIRFARASLRASRALARALRPAAPRLLDSPLGRRAIMGQMFRHPERLSPAEALADLVAFAEGEGFDGALHESSGFRFTRVDAEQISVPVTVAWGTRDFLLPVRQARRARERLPDARHVPLPGCGHVPMIDDPVAVADVVLAGSGGV